MCFSSGGGGAPAPTQTSSQPERAAPAAPAAAAPASEAVQKPGNRGSRDAQGRTTGGSRRTAIGKSKGLAGTVLTKGPVLGATGTGSEVSGKTLLGS